MSNLFSKPKVSAKQGRNGFDISQSRMFSASPGMLLPYYTDYANAGDSYRIKPSAFIRTEAIKTAAMMRLNIHLDFYFVPFRQMFMFWNEIYNLTWDVHTSFVAPLDSSQHLYIPGYNYSAAFAGSHFVSTSPSNPLMFYQSSADTIYHSVDSFGIPKAFNYRRLWDMLDYGKFNDTHTTQNNQKFNLFKFLAYHKIFYSYFNDSIWFSNDASLYNLDAYYNLPDVGNDPVINKIFSTLHYRPWRRDYFTNIFPSPSFNSGYSNFVQPFGNTGDANYPTLSKINPERLAAIDDVSQASSLYKPLDNNGVVSLDLGETLGVDNISIQDIRSMFALDKFLRITGSCGSHYDQQTLAHLGVKIPAGLNGECYHVGSHSFPLIISDVVATSSTTAEGVGSVIGDVAGKGFASGHDGAPVFKFTAPESGVLMGIFSIEPEPDYQGVDICNYFTNTYDFYHPEFENLGLAPFYQFQLNGNVGNVSSLAVAGWTYRYSELKTKYDIISESIYSTDKTIWQGNRQDHSLFVSNGAVSRFNLFYINPQYCNNIFAMMVPKYVNFTGGTTDGTLKLASASALFGDTTLSPSNVYSYDNFIVNTFTNCYKTSIMSVHSLPKL